VVAGTLVQPRPLLRPARFSIEHGEPYTFLGCQHREPFPLLKPVSFTCQN
jgi:hypothetical protein